MNAKTAKMIRRASNYNPVQPVIYDDPVLHRVLQMQAYETYERTIREMGPVSPGAPTNLRKGLTCAMHPAQWVQRSGNRRMVTSRTVEKIRYQTDGKTPAKPLTTWNKEKNQFDPVYTLIPCTKPRHLKAGSQKRVYRELKRLEQRVGLDALHARLVAESVA